MRIRVLLADDHTLMREGLRVLLGPAPDIEVVGEVATGRDAVRRAALVRPHVVLMDITMPDMNGIEAVRRLAERQPAARVIMLSMHGNGEHVHRSLAAGAAGYLLKDCPAEEVAVAVRAVHAGGTYLDRGLRHLAGRLATRSPLDSLSPRERQVLQLVVEGRTSAEIALMVHLSPKSVETYRGRLMAKLGMPDLPALVKFAVQHGITTLD